MLDKIEPSWVVFGAVLVEKFNNWFCCFVHFKTGYSMYVVYRSNSTFFLKIKRFHIFRYLKSLCGRTEFILLTHFGGVVLRHMAQFFRHEMADGGNHASVGCTARHKCVSMAESCHPYGFGGGYGGYGAFFGLQRPPLSSPSTFLNFYLKMN